MVATTFRWIRVALIGVVPAQAGIVWYFAVSVRYLLPDMGIAPRLSSRNSAGGAEEC